MLKPLKMTRAFLLFFASLFLTLTAGAIPPPPLPNINTANVFNIVDYGADVASADNAVAIQSAINDASAASGGGTVEIPAPGTYLSGPLTMQSQVNLQVDAGATLMMLARSNWPSATTPFINSASVNDIEFSGSGTIDGHTQFGPAEWWGNGGGPVSPRPNFLLFNGCNRILIQNVRLQNPPTFHIMIKGDNANVTIQNINIDTDPNSPNTDGMDVGSTNMLIQNCHITDGDDNIELGGSKNLAAWITITNCVFGHGHGVSVGSLTQAGVHDVTVINCLFTNTEYGIKMKSDNDRGGLIQNMTYYNLTMSNLVYAPISIYGYYNTLGGVATTHGLTPTVAANTAIAAVTATEPAFRDIVISNITATCQQPGLIFPRTEYPATNIFLTHLNITSANSAPGNGSFAIYNARGVVVSDSQIQVASVRKTFEMFNAQVMFSNTVPGAAAISLDGFKVTNALAFHNQSASLSDTSFFGATSISVDASVITNGTFLNLSNTVPVNFTLGTNATRIAVAAPLTLNSTVNISTGAGFGLGTYTLFTYSGFLNGTPTLGTTPALNYYMFALNTNTPGQVNLMVTLPSPVIGNMSLAGTNLIISGTGGVTNGSYYLLSSTNLALPLSQWTRLSTNPFDASGGFSVTNSSGTNAGIFYLLQLP
jgi:hypothetical protein